MPPRQTAQGTRQIWPDPITTPLQRAELVPWKNPKRYLTTPRTYPKVIYMANNTRPTWLVIIETYARHSLKAGARKKWKQTGSQLCATRNEAERNIEQRRTRDAERLALGHTMPPRRYKITRYTAQGTGSTPADLAAMLNQ